MSRSTNKEEKERKHVRAARFPVALTRHARSSHGSLCRGHHRCSTSWRLSFLPDIRHYSTKKSASAPTFVEGKNFLGRVEEAYAGVIEQKTGVIKSTFSKGSLKQHLLEKERADVLLSLSNVPRTLHITRPVISFDLETTGLGPTKQRIISMSFVKVHPPSQKNGLSTDTYRIEVFCTGMGNIRPADGSIYLNPEGIPSHPMALQLHGIQDAELVAPLPTFSAHAEQLRSFLAGSIMTGYNITKFDLAFLTAEFHRCGITWSPAGEGIGTIDTLALYRRFRPQEYKRGGKLFSAYLHFVGGWQTQAHNAEADAFTALRLLYAMVEDPDIQTSVAMSLQGLYYPSRTDETSR